MQNLCYKKLMREEMYEEENEKSCGIMSVVMMVTALPMEVLGVGEELSQDGEVVLEQGQEDEDREVLESEEMLDAVLPETDVEGEVETGETDTAEEEIENSENDVEELLFPSDPILNSRSANANGISVYGTVIDSGDCGATEADDLTWTVYDSDLDGVGDMLVISGNGNMKNFPYGYWQLPWYTYKRKS